MEFREYPKIARLNRECVITEKIDGTNGCVVITEDAVCAQSRNRLLISDTDPFGFALWVERHKDALRAALGPGYHFGEWWGSGIQRRYGLTGTDKRFSLFNVARWQPETERGAFASIPGLGVVPTLQRGLFTSPLVLTALDLLRTTGSLAAPGFMQPEGVVVFHVAANIGFKVTLEKDDEPKGRPSAPPSGSAG